MLPFCHGALSLMFQTNVEKPKIPEKISFSLVLFIRHGTVEVFYGTFFLMVIRRGGVYFAFYSMFSEGFVNIFPPCSVRLLKLSMYATCV